MYRTWNYFRWFTFVCKFYILHILVILWFYGTRRIIFMFIKASSWAQFSVSWLYPNYFSMINFNFPSCWLLHLSLNFPNGMIDVFLTNWLLHLITLTELCQQCKLWSSLSCTFLQSFVTDLTSRASFPNVSSVHIPRPHSLRQSTVTVTSHGRVTELVSVFVHAIGWGSKWPTSRVICLSKQSRTET